jgi:hypothetical protein
MSSQPVWNREEEVLKGSRISCASPTARRWAGWWPHCLSLNRRIHRSRPVYGMPRSEGRRLFAA